MIINDIIIHIVENVAIQMVLEQAIVVLSVLDWGLMWGNIMKKRLMSFASGKTPCISLSSAQYWEYKYGPVSGVEWGLKLS